MSERKKPRVIRLAEAYLERCGRWERALADRPGAFDQVHRAAISILANAGEALESITMPQKCKYFGYARASAGESERVLRGLRRAGALARSETDAALALLRDLRWDLTRLINWTQR